MQRFVPMFMVLSAVPYYLLGLILVYIFAFVMRLLPLGGAYSSGTVPQLDLDFLLDVIRHGMLPALSIVLTSVGFWALGMRGVMVTVLGEDYLTLAEAKGLPDRRIFFAYAMRNALLPQVTSLAIAWARWLPARCWSRWSSIIPASAGCSITRCAVRIIIWFKASPSS